MRNIIYGNTKITLEDAIKIVKTRGWEVRVERETIETGHFMGRIDTAYCDNYILVWNGKDSVRSNYGEQVGDGYIVRHSAVFEECKDVLDNHIKDMAVKSLLNLAETL